MTFINHEQATVKKTTKKEARKSFWEITKILRKEISIVKLGNKIRKTPQEGKEMKKYKSKYKDIPKHKYHYLYPSNRIFKNRLQRT